MGKRGEEERGSTFFSSFFPRKKIKDFFFFNLWFKFQTKFYYLYEHYGSFKKMCSKNQKLFIRVNDGGRILINSPGSKKEERGKPSFYRHLTLLTNFFDYFFVSLK